MKPTIIYDSSGPQGNIFWILGAAKNALRKQRRINEYNELWERVQSSHSYTEALSILSERVDLVDLAKISRNA